MSTNNTKFVIVDGVVVSGLGKGVTASSIGLLLKASGYTVTAIKIDPYLNVDAGTMSPYEHGECYVLDDGGETDLDLGNYERFIDVNLTRANNITTGQVYSAVIEKERKGAFLGKTVQVVPHITDYIQNHIETVAKLPVDESGKVPDICIIEVGGTIGDIESMPFLMALAQFIQDRKDSVCVVQVTLIPTLANGEMKTKPTQRGVADAKSAGVAPDILVCRCDDPLDDELKRKLKSLCHIPCDHILSNYNVDSIYRVPDVLYRQGIHRLILNKFGLPENECKLDDYNRILSQFDRDLPLINIGIVGKYTGSQDSYLSLKRALEHACFYLEHKLVIHWIEAEEFEKLDNNSSYTSKVLDTMDGILVPGGFGNRGIEGMINAAKYAREHKIPYFGICLGMQVMLIEAARNLMNWEGANSTEFDTDTLYPIIRKSRKLTDKLGGTMRLGRYDVHLQGKAYDLYKKLYPNSVSKTTYDRHRHRYEVKNKLFRRMIGKGIVKLGGDSEDNVVEIVESPHSSEFWMGCQFHPEYRSKNNKPHWLFVGFLEACLKRVQ